MRQAWRLIAMPMLYVAISGGLGDPAIAADGASAAHSSANRERKDFAREPSSLEARRLVEWVLRSGDAHRKPFIVIDKIEAKLFAFDAGGKLVGTTPTLLGTGVGDSFAQGVLEMDMYATQPWQRVTPAGRFLAEEGVNLSGERVLWVDYDAGIAIHKLPSRRTNERRHERIASPSPADNRITYGCINVPGAFYDGVIARHFRRGGGIVYVLPEELVAELPRRMMQGPASQGRLQ